VGLGSGAQNTAGTFSGTAPIVLTSDGTGTSGLGTTSLTGQTVTVTGSVWNLASAAAITPTPINLGIVHVGGTFGTQALTVQNTAAANVSEGLDASFGTLTGSASTNGGSITTLAAGPAANTTSLVVGLGGSAHTATAGAVTGTAPVTLTSDGAGTSGLGTTPLTSQTVTINGQVNNFAQPLFSLTNAVGTLTGSGTSYTLNLAGTSSAADLSVANTSVSPGFQDTLGGSYAPTTLPDYTVTGATSFSGVAAGSSQSGLTVSLTGSSSGKSESLIFTPTSTNGSGSSNLSAITLTINDSASTTVATIDNTQTINAEPGTFGGSVITSSVPVGAAGSNGYAGVTSTVGAGIGAQGSASAGIEGTLINEQATILVGSNSGNFTGSASATPSMTWRTRLLEETPANDKSANGSASGFVAGNPTNPPVRLPLISDVVDLFGMSSVAGDQSKISATNAPTPIQTDPFVFQMAFNPATLKAEGATNADMGTRGNLYLASLVSGSWVNTITADFAIGTGTTTTTTYNGSTIPIGVDTLAAMPNGISKPFEGTFAAWEQAQATAASESLATFQTFFNSNVGDYIGVYGVDADTLGSNEYNAWSIINHNSEFAVVPEPSAIVLAAFGLFGCMIVMRRRKSLVTA